MPYPPTLTSGTPYWLTTNGLPPVHPVLTHDLRCEVAILGAGISGALVADALTAAGVEVVLLDAHYPGTGATSASTALLQFEVDTPLTELAAHLGGDTARAARSYQAVYRALRRLTHETVPELGAEIVGFQATTSLYLATKASELPDLVREVAARRAAGLPAEFLSGAEVESRYHIRRPGAIFTAEAGQLDALRLTTALHRRTLARGGQLFERTPVVAYEADATGVTLTTAHNFRVRARQVVICTGYQTPEWVRGIRVDLRSSFALATEPLRPADRWPTDCHLWETARPYLYCRVTPEGRVIAGGGDLPFTQPTAREAVLRARTRTLLGKLRELLPHLPPRVDFEWAGTFGESTDGLPYISRHPAYPGAWFALGFGGNGIVFSALAAELITAAITGQQHPDLALFGFDRPGV